MDYSYLLWQILASVLAYIAPFLILVLVVYVLAGVALYKIAKKFHYPNAWMAWVPIASTYLMFILPVKKFKILIFNKELERTHAFWIYLACAVGEIILCWIPVLNILALLAIIAGIICFFYPVYHDLYEMFVDESTATTYAIISLVIPGAALIFALIVASKEPRLG